VLSMNSHRYLATSSAPVRPMDSLPCRDSSVDISNGESHGSTLRKLGDMSNCWSFGALDIDLLPAPGVPTFV
jgi:hypothetical protein